MYIEKVEFKQDIAYVYVAGCSNNCKQCRKSPPKINKNFKYSDIKNTLISQINNNDICQVIIAGDDPLYCGNKKDLIDFVTSISVFKISIISKYNNSWFNNEKHIEIVSNE